MERTGRIEEMDREFALRFWQAQSDTERFAAAWEPVVQAFIIKGKDVNQLRLQRTVEHFAGLAKTIISSPRFLISQRKIMS